MKKVILCLILGIQILLLCSFANYTKYDEKQEETTEKESISCNENEENNSNTIEKEEVLKAIKELKKQLQKNKTSVENEYKKLLKNTEKNSKQNKVDVQQQAYIDSLKECIKKHSSNNTKGNNSENQDEEEDSLIVHEQAVAYLSSKGYVLAAELLQYMKINTLKNSTYKPLNKDVLTKTQEYTNLKGTNVLKGTGTFPNSDGTICGQDAYLSLHNYYYNKTSSNSGIVITDRYDFDIQTYSNIFVSTANNVMAQMQAIGLLTPYYVIIGLSENESAHNSSFSFSFSNRDVYFEKYGVIGKNDRLEFYFDVNADANKTFQTFGPDDTILELYESNGTFVAADDNSGYENNACICPFLKKEKRYKLVVKLNNDEVSANIRIGISSTICTNYNELSVIEKSYFGTSIKDVDVIAYKYLANNYLINKDYKFKLSIGTTYKMNRYYDTVMYVVNPRRSDYYTIVDFDHNPPLYIYDDDSGGNLQARIDLDNRFYTKNTPYFLVSSIIDLSQSGEYKIITPKE